MQQRKEVPFCLTIHLLERLALTFNRDVGCEIILMLRLQALVSFSTFESNSAGDGGAIKGFAADFSVRRSDSYCAYFEEDFPQIVSCMFLNNALSTFSTGVAIHASQYSDFLVCVQT